MRKRVNQARFKGVFRQRDEAALVLAASGDIALVERGMPRLLVMRCPCGCGDTLIINVDRRVGPAWRLYKRGDFITLYPSYWRDTHCECHFILWRNRIYWCDWEDEPLWTSSHEIEEVVYQGLPETFISYEALAESLQLIPWEVLQACRSLVRSGRAFSNALRKGEFRKSALK